MKKYMEERMEKSDMHQHLDMEKARHTMARAHEMGDLERHHMRPNNSQYGDREMPMNHKM